MNFVSVRSIFIFLGAALCASALLAGQESTPQIHAQPPSTESAATVSLSRNVYSAGSTVRTSRAVDGDFVGFGARVVVDHAVQGDASLAGGSIDLRAPVGDDVRAAGGDVSIESHVGGELLAAGGNVMLAPSALIEQGATLAGGNVTIDGRVIGPLKVKAQKIVLHGEVSGDAELAAEQIELGPTAKIGGTLRYAANELKRADGAIIGGTITRDEDQLGHPERHAGRQWHDGSPAAPWFASALAFFGLLAAGTALLLVFPRFSIRAPEQIQVSPWLSMAFGFGALVGTPILAVLLFITLLGIPLGIATLALYPGLLLMGYLTTVLFVAQRAQAAMRKDAPATFGSTMGFVALALLMLMLISRLPVIGSLTIFLSTIAGMGACFLEWRRRRKAPPAH